MGALADKGNQVPRFRPSGCGFEQSMQKVQRVEDFRQLLQVISSYVGRKVNPEEIKMDPYGVDPRNRWDTWAVILVDFGPVGFTNACLDPDFNPEQSQFSGLAPL